MTFQDQSGSTGPIVNTTYTRIQEAVMTIMVQKAMMKSVQQDPVGAGRSYMHKYV